MSTVTLHPGDALNVLRTLPDNSVHAVVTDPPYGLSEVGSEKLTTALTAWVNGDRERVPSGKGFMGKEWDAFVPPPAVWDECLRVLKPGGHMLVFAGSRTVDLMGLSIRLAGFEIRDSISCATGQLAWYYGSGFPKSRNVSRDPNACQCVPDLRDTATEDAAESAAEILLEEVRRRGETHAARLEDLHGLSVGLHPHDPLSGRTQADVQSGMSRGDGPTRSPGEPAAGDSSSDSAVHGVRQGNDHGSVLAKTSGEPDVFAPVQRESAWAGLGDARAQGSCSLVGGDGGSILGEPAGREKPGMAWRGDVQAAEGQLPGPAVREVSSGVGDDGPLGRVRDGASSRDGAVGGATADPSGVREPHRPQSAEQRAGESGAVPDQRRPQAWRGWPVCPGCGKPRLPAGLGTSLKPAHEPILCARKPLDGTVARNVLAHGVGGLNIDGCRVSMSDTDRDAARVPQRSTHGYANLGDGEGRNGERFEPAIGGRFPANVILTHNPDCDDVCDEGCPVAELDAQSGVTTSSAAPRNNTAAAHNNTASMGKSSGDWTTGGHSDSGGASRFFPSFRYQAKAPKRERPKVDGVSHPTVKPLALMRWLVRLVTPPGGTVLDPFAGSGTTLQAAQEEGFAAVGIERDANYQKLIEARLAA